MNLASYLLGLGTAVLSWLAGLAASTFLQDREHVRRQRGSVGVLLTELRRIQAQLGGTDTRWIDTGILGYQAAIPEIHPWVQASIFETAQSDPSILAQFMQLDLLLRNQELFVAALRQRRDEVHVAVEQLKGRPESTGSASPEEAAVAEILARLTAKQERDQRERAVRDAVEFVDMNHRNITRALAALVKSMEDVDERLRREPSFNVKRLLGAPVVLLRDQPETVRKPDLPQRGGAA